MEALTGFGFFSALGSVVRNLRLVHRICGVGPRVWKDDIVMVTATDKNKSGTFSVSSWKAGLVIPAFHFFKGEWQATFYTNSFIIMPNCYFTIYRPDPSEEVYYSPGITSWSLSIHSTNTSMPPHSIFLFNWD